MGGPAAPIGGACAECRRRSWLLGDLSPLLDYHRGEQARLAELLELEGSRLIAALAGGRRDQLAQAYRELEGSAIAGEGICAHAPGWPAALGRAAGTRMLWSSTPPARLGRLLEAPAIAILGSRAAGPYGLELAGGLARGLAAAGVTVVAGLAGELARAVHLGAMEGRGGSLAVAGDGLERIRPERSARLARELGRAGSVVSELPARASGRGWGAVAAEHRASEIAGVAILVEDEPDGAATGIARSAMDRGLALGAVPGPVTSPLSAGPHAMLMAGACLIRDARDALELLYSHRPEPAPQVPESSRAAQVEHRLRRVLARVAAGEDTAERLGRGAPDPGEVAAALGELEALGLVRRLPGGRYMARGRL